MKRFLCWILRHKGPWFPFSYYHLGVRRTLPFMEERRCERCGTEDVRFKLKEMSTGQSHSLRRFISDLRLG